MAITVPTAWVHQFNSMLLETMQQTEAIVKPRLLANATRSGVSAAIDTWERVGGVQLQPIGRHTQTVQLNPVHTRRAATMQTVGGGILLSPNVDVIRMLIQPQSSYRSDLAAAAVQTIDKTILDAAIGAATTVSTSSTTAQMTYGSQAMVSSYIIGGATAMDLTRIIAASVLLSKGNCPTGSRNRVFFFSAGQETDIYSITQASSSDFTKNRIHDEGINGISWQGFEWVEIQDVVDQTAWVSTATAVAVSNMLPLVSTTRSCIAMYKGGVGFSSAQDITPDISTRNDLNNEIQVYVSLTQAAVRLWEGAVVKVNALEN
jgi:hypothetical protein